MQISASIKPEIIEAIKEVQKKEKIESFSQMVETILGRDTQVIKFIKPKK